MQAALKFDPSRLPRTMTRAEWRGVSRWLRIAQRMINKEFDLNLEVWNRRMADVMLFGSSTWVA